MRGARAAAANGIPHIAEQIAALERAVVENPTGGLIDYVRTLASKKARRLGVQCCRQQQLSPKISLYAAVLPPACQEHLL
jgi:hypothetical protein